MAAHNKEGRGTEAARRQERGGEEGRLHGERVIGGGL